MPTKPRVDKEHIDASIFLGMHHIDDSIRIACKNYFVKNLKRGVLIKVGLEQIGKCDDVIWGFPRAEQDAYYPFMDALHTTMNIRGIPYDMDDLNTVLSGNNLHILTLSDILAIAMATRDGETLNTINQRILSIKGLPVSTPESGVETMFPDDLEELYVKSLKLRIRYKGIIPPLITPFNKNGDVCELSVKKMIAHVYPYSSALMPVLTSGEGWKLSKKQWSDMVDYTLVHSMGLPVLAGVEYSTTREVIEYGALAKKKGVEAIVVTTPFDKDLSQKDIYQHFQKIINSVDMPLFIYNEMGISGNHIELETMLRICRLGGIVGVKEASGDINYTNKLIQSLDVPVFQGWENLAEDTLNPAGYIFPLANLDPEICRAMLCNSTQRLQQKINKLCKEYDILDATPYINIKKTLARFGIISSDSSI